MIITTTNVLDGYQVMAYIGLFKGLIVRSPTISQGILSGFKNVIGGNQGSLADMRE